MTLILAVAYGVASYLDFLTAFVYAIGFAGNVIVPKSMDDTERELSADFDRQASATNSGCFLCLAPPRA